MKRIFIVILALFLVVPLISQEGNSEIVKNGFKKGYACNIDMGGLLTAGDYGVKLVIVNSYQFNPHFSIGIGTGFWFDWTVPSGGDGGKNLKGPIGPLLPVFADFRVNLLNKKLSPYFSMGLGALFSYPGEYTFSTHGLISPAIGLSYKVSKWFVLNASFGINLDLYQVYQTQ